MSRRAQNPRYDWLYAVGALIAIGAFFSIPFFLSRVEITPPIQAAPVVETRPVVPVLGGALVFRDADTQAREFIGYYHTVELTPEQEAIKKEVLAAMPAACCSGSTAYTCCCPCNLSKTIWGLSNYVIAKHGADAAGLREAVNAWMGFVNPNGYAGNACYKGGCEGSLSGGGCGAMKEEKLNV